MSKEKVKELVEVILTKAESKDQIKVAYKGWKSIFAPVTHLNLNLIYDGIKLVSGYVADKNYLPDLLRNGLISELGASK